jgi:hypothetical protein
MSNNNTDDEQYSQVGCRMPYGVLLVGLWMLAGLVSFVMSLACFGYSGTFAQHLLGLVIAVLFGPFYFIYYASSTTYCR